jgi:hypothetical protein
MPIPAPYAGAGGVLANTLGAPLPRARRARAERAFDSTVERRPMSTYALAGRTAKAKQIGWSRRRIPPENRLSLQHVDPLHNHELRSLAELLRMGIELEAHCDFFGTTEERAWSRAVFLAHFESWREALSEWDELVDRERTGPNALWEELAQACEERGLTEPRVSSGPLIDQLAVRTVKRARGWELDSPSELGIQIAPSRLGGELQYSLYIDTQRVASLADSSTTDVEGEMLELAKTIQAVFDKLQGSSGARAISDNRDRLLTLKRRLLSGLANAEDSYGIAAAARCPVCVESMQSQAPLRDSRY